MIKIALKIALRFIFFKDPKSQLGFVRKTFFLAFFGLTASIISLTLLDSINNGYKKSVNSKLLEIDSHIEIFNTNQKYIDINTAYSIIDFFENKEILKDFSFLSQGDGIVRMKDRVEPVLVTAIISGDKNRYRKVYSSKKDSLSGENEVVLGQGLANKLNIEYFSSVYLFDINDFISNGIVYQKAVSPALINTVNFGIPQYNNHFAQLDINTFKRLFNHNNVYKILINLKQTLNHAIVIENLKKHFQSRYSNDYMFVSFDDKYSPLNESLDQIFSSISIIIFFLVVICLLNIISTISLIVESKKKQIMILRVNGMTKYHGGMVFIFIILTSVFVSLVFSLLSSLFIIGVQNHFQFISLPSNVYIISRFIGIFDFYYFIQLSFYLIIFSILLSVPSIYKKVFKDIVRI